MKKRVPNNGRKMTLVVGGTKKNPDELRGAKQVSVQASPGIDPGLVVGGLLVAGAAIGLGYYLVSRNRASVTSALQTASKQAQLVGGTATTAMGNVLGVGGVSGGTASMGVSGQQVPLPLPSPTPPPAASAVPATIASGGSNVAVGNAAASQSSTVDPMGRHPYEIGINLSMARIDWVRLMLAALDYAVNPDGTLKPGFRMGVPITADLRSAISAFQGAYATDAARHPEWQPRSLTVDGTIGPNTLRALQNYAAYAQSRGMGNTAMPA